MSDRITREANVPEIPFPPKSMLIEPTQERIREYLASIMPELPETLRSHIARVLSASFDQYTTERERLARIDEVMSIVGDAKYNTRLMQDIVTVQSLHQRADALINTKKEEV